MEDVPSRVESEQVISFDSVSTAKDAEVSGEDEDDDVEDIGISF